MKRSLLCNEPRIWKDCHFKASLESCRPCSLLTCQAGIKRPPIIISLFSNEPIVYLHLGWQPSRARGAAEAREVAIQILHVLVGDSLQHMLKVFFFTLEMLEALGNSDLGFWTAARISCQRKGNLEDLGEGNLDMHIILDWMWHFLNFWRNPSIYPSKKEREKNSLYKAYKIQSLFLSFTNHLSLI